MKYYEQIHSLDLFQGMRTDIERINGVYVWWAPPSIFYF